MEDYIIGNSVLNVDDYEIKVSIIQDWHSSPLDHIETTEVSYNPLPINAAWGDGESPFDYTDFAIDNSCHDAYFTIDRTWNEPKGYFMLNESVKYLQKEFSKIGYAKNEAWLKALKSLKFQAQYVQSYFRNDWVFVGIGVEVTKFMTDDNGLIWSTTLPCDHLWGVEWGMVGSFINDNDNELNFKSLIPDLLPDEVHLNDHQLNELWDNLE